MLRFAAFFKKISKITMNTQLLVRTDQAPEAAALRAWAALQHSAVKKENWTHSTFAHESTFASPSQILSPVMPVSVLLIMEIV